MIDENQEYNQNINYGEEQKQAFLDRMGANMRQADLIMIENQYGKNKHVDDTDYLAQWWNGDEGFFQFRDRKSRQNQKIKDDRQAKFQKQKMQRQKYLQQKQAEWKQHNKQNFLLKKQLKKAKQQKDVAKQNQLNQQIKKNDEKKKEYQQIKAEDNMKKMLGEQIGGDIVKVKQAANDVYKYGAQKVEDAVEAVKQTWQDLTDLPGHLWGLAKQSPWAWGIGGLGTLAAISAIGGKPLIQAGFGLATKGAEKLASGINWLGKKAFSNVFSKKNSSISKIKKPFSRIKRNVGKINVQIPKNSRDTSKQIKL